MLVLMTYNKYKITIEMLAISTAALLFVPLIANAAPNENGNGPPSQIPPPPPGLGCNHYTPQKGWKSVECMPEELVIAQGIIPMEGGSYGVKGGHATTSVLNQGKVAVSFTTFNGVSDNFYGTNAWSIQSNTNYFTGNNGHTDSVQFVFQNNPGGNWARNCVWNNDVQTQTYTPTCVATTIQTLSTGNVKYVQGISNPTTLTSIYCTGTTCWSVTASDLYGLRNKWSDASGTILGIGNASTANFVSPTNESTTITASASQSFTMNIVTTFVTAEKNNLNYGTPTKSCGSSSCTITVSSTN